MELVTVAVFPNAFHAHLVEGRLQADGIECYIKDEHVLNVNPLFSSALGGIKLQVKAGDVQTAVALLHAQGYRTVFDVPQVPAKKEQHILIRFLKFLAAAAVVLGWLYFTEFGGK